MASNADLSIQQFMGAWNIFCAAASRHAFHAEPGLEFAFAGVPIQFFNIAVLSGSEITGEQLQKHAARARVWADTHGVPWMLVITQERLAVGVDAVAALDACGYAPTMPLYGMLAQQVPPIDRLPQGLTLKRAEDDASCSAVIDINSQAYGIPLDVAKDIWGKASFWSNHVEVLGTAASKPVSSTAVFMVSGYRYVALVATAPSEQRNGYADATMRRALEISRQKNGDAPTFLHASEAGRPVYERMGYETVAHHTAYMDKKFLGDH